MHGQLREQGFCVVPGVLSADDIARVNAAIEAAIAESRRRGVATYTDFMDPNDRNVRLYTLPDFDPVFIELLRRPLALDLVRALLGDGFIVSSFTANIALPGSRPMNWHSDQALVVPAPWSDPWAINVIWCIDDVHDANGATRYVPGSHRYRSFAEVPDDLAARSVPFEASAGSIIAMDGRLWHSSGANRSDDERRAMLFAYYAKDFIRPQTNHEAALSPQTKASLDDDARALLGMGADANVRLGADLVRLGPDAIVDTSRTLGRTL